LRLQLAKIFQPMGHAMNFARELANQR